MRRFIFIVASFFSVAVCCGIALAKTYFLPEYNPIAQTRTSTIDGDDDDNPWRNWEEDPDDPDPDDPDPEDDCDCGGFSEEKCGDNAVTEETCECNGQILYRCGYGGGGGETSSCADDGYTLCDDDCIEELGTVKVKLDVAKRLLTTSLLTTSEYDVYGFPKKTCKQGVGNEAQYYYKPDGGFSCGEDYNALDKLGEHQVLANDAIGAAEPVTVRCDPENSGNNGNNSELYRYVYNLGYKGFMAAVSEYDSGNSSTSGSIGLLHYYYKRYTNGGCLPADFKDYSTAFAADPFRFICGNDYCSIEDGTAGTDNREDFCKTLYYANADDITGIVCLKDPNFSWHGHYYLCALTRGLAIPDGETAGVSPDELLSGCENTLAYDGGGAYVKGYWNEPYIRGGRDPEYCYDGNKLYYKLGECNSKYKYTNKEGVRTYCKYLSGDTCEYDGVT